MLQFVWSWWTRFHSLAKTYADWVWYSSKIGELRPTNIIYFLPIVTKPKTKSELLAILGHYLCSRRDRRRPLRRRRPWRAGRGHGKPGRVTYHAIVLSPGTFTSTSYAATVNKKNLKICQIAYIQELHSAVLFYETTVITPAFWHIYAWKENYFYRKCSFQTW